MVVLNPLILRSCGLGTVPCVSVLSHFLLLRFSAGSLRFPFVVLAPAGIAPYSDFGNIFVKFSMDEEDKRILGNNSIEDVEWLCSLSESELDMLVSLKMLAIHRAKVIGHEELANKFDLKMLRALGFILMEYVKEKVKDLPLGPGFTEATMLMDNCNLLKSKVENTMSIEELKSYVDSRKRPSNRRLDGCHRPDAAEQQVSLKRKRGENFN